MVSLLLQQTLIVARDLSGQFLLRLGQEVHPGLTLLEETLLLEHQRLQLTVVYTRAETTSATA